MDGMPARRVPVIMTFVAGLGAGVLLASAVAAPAAAEPRAMNRPQAAAFTRSIDELISQRLANPRLGENVGVFAVDPAATGKYVFAPGLREEFGADAFGGYFDLQTFFAAPWPEAALAEGTAAG